MVKLVKCNNCFIHPKSSECQEFCDTRRIIVIRDRRSTQWTFENPMGKCVCQIKIDGCIVADQDVKKCDYLFLVCDETGKSAFFVELKGADLNQAMAQILSTVQQLKNELRDFCLYARVALTKGKPPSIAPTNEKKLKELLEKHNQSKERYRKIVNYQATYPSEEI